MQRNVEYVKLETAKAGKTVRLVLHYKVLSGPKQGEIWKIGALAPQLDQSSKDKLKASKAGDIISIIIEKEGNFWNLKSVGEPATSSEANAKSSAAPKFDNIGIKVGAARNQALAFLSAVKGKSFSLDDVDEVAAEIFHRQAAQEKALSTNKAAQPKVEEVGEDDVVVDDSDDEIEF